MVLKKYYEKIVLFLSLITLILVIYYLVKTYFKHNIILESFSEKTLYSDVKFRDCQVYFTNDKEKCDRDYAANNKDTCKYMFEDWKEIDKIGDGAIKKHKVYVDNKLNESDYANIREETRCFYKLEKDDDKSGDNTMIIDNNYYAYNDFYPFSIDNSICNIVAPIKTGIKGKQFYEFILDKENSLVDIKKVSISAQQNSFIVDSTFTISKFIEKYGNGLEYYKENEFRVYKISKFPDFDVKVHKFTYNYLCYNTQVKNYSMINAKIQLNNFLTSSNKEEIIQLTDNIDTNIAGIKWDNYKNSDSKNRTDKKSAIIKALEDRKKVVQDEIDENDAATSTNLSLIKQEIIDDSVIRKYQLTTYYDSNKEIWNQSKFLNQFSVHNYKREYLTKSADATIDSTIVDVTIRIKNNFQKGLKWFKVDGYYHDNIEYIRNKEYIKDYDNDDDYGEIRGFRMGMSTNITKFKGLKELTNEILSANRDNTYTMWFTGYFYAHDAGNYIFGTKSDDASHVYLNDNLIVNNGGHHDGMIERKSGNNYLNKGEIYKLDIYFGEDGGGDDLEFFWTNRWSQKIYTSDFNGKTWIYHTQNSVNTNRHIPLIGNTQYVDCLYSDLNHKVVYGSSGDIYYEFKNTDFIYDVIVNKSTEAKILVVGGGGGGGMDMGGGGGAGGYIEDNNLSLIKDDKLTIIVGNGGHGAPEGGLDIQGKKHQFKIRAKRGNNTVVSINSEKKYRALGGGFGGSSYLKYTPGMHGGDGGSGGGSSGYYPHPNNGKYGVALLESSQGNNGKNQYDVYTSGGGGGAGEPSYDSRGGNGKSTNITGKNIYFAGGGGGGGYIKSGGDGGIGGGGGGATGKTKGGIGYNSGEPGGGGEIKRWTNTPGGRGGDNTGGGGGGGSHYNRNNRGGRGGSGIVILRIINKPTKMLAKCNYYIPPISQITPYLPKSDVMNSKISFEVINQANPKSLFYSSYIYLKNGYYKFNFDMDTSNHSDLYTKSKIIIYDNKDKKTFISVYKDNLVTKKWVYIPDTKYYIINLCIVYISGRKYDIPFSVKARYASGEKSNGINFSNSELSIDEYEGLTSSDSSKYKDMTGYIYRQDDGHIDKINNMADDYNDNFNKFLESYFLLNTSFGKVIDYFKLLGKRNNEKKSNINIQKIDKLIEKLNNIDLNGYFDKTNDNLNLSGTATSIFAANTILDINDYITFKQYVQADKNELKGADDTFDILKHAERSIYMEVF